jgi:quercetin dioxygenase-like cupin family protein
MTGQFGFLNISLPFAKIELVWYQGRAGLSRARHDRDMARANRHNPGKTGLREQRMYAFNIDKEQEWDAKKHVEKILAELDVGGGQAGDYTVACWEPGQVSPNHCHPYATEIYFCFSGGGKMRLPSKTIDVVPGSFCVHPPGEVHEYINGPQRSLLFRVRHGTDMLSRHVEWPSNPDFKQSAEDAEYYRNNPPR